VFVHFRVLQFSLSTYRACKPSVMTAFVATVQHEAGIISLIMMLFNACPEKMAPLVFNFDKVQQMFVIYGTIHCDI